MLRKPRVAVLGIVLAFLFAAAAQAQVTKQVPADAWVVVKIKNLQALSASLGELATQFGIDKFAGPAAKDPLAMLREQANIKEGLKIDADAAFVFMDPDSAGGRPDKSMLILIPVTDYAAFIKNFPEPKKDGELDQINLGGDEGFAANWGSYAALAPGKEMLAKKPAGLTVAGTAAAKAFESDDVAVYVNTRALRTKFAPMLKEAKPELIKEVERNVGQMLDPKYMPIVKAAVNQMLNTAEQMLNEAAALTFSLKFSKDGIGTSLLAEFEPGSQIGKNIAGLKTTDTNLLAGLPAGEYGVYGGFVQDPKLAVQMVDDFTGPMVKELAGLGEQGKVIQTALDAWKKQLVALNGGAMGLMVQPGSPSGMLKGIGVMNGDAKAMISAQKEARKSAEELMKMFPGPAQKVTVTDNAKTVDGVSFDMTRQKLEMEPKTPEEMMAKQMMDMMYGPNGATAYMGAADASTVIAVLGDDEALLKQAVEAAKAKTDTLSKQANIQAVADKLPKNKVGVIYIALDNLASAGVKVLAQQMNPNMKLQLPPNLPPVGVAIATEGSAVRIDSFIPSQTVASLIAAGMQLQDQMRRGGAGRPGDL